MMTSAIRPTHLLLNLLSLSFCLPLSNLKGFLKSVSVDLFGWWKEMCFNLIEAGISPTLKPYAGGVLMEQVKVLIFLLPSLMAAEHFLKCLCQNQSGTCLFNSWPEKEKKKNPITSRLVKVGSVSTSARLYQWNNGGSSFDISLLSGLGALRGERGTSETHC